MKLYWWSVYVGHQFAQAHCSWSTQEPLATSEGTLVEKRARYIDKKTFPMEWKMEDKVRIFMSTHNLNLKIDCSHTAFSYIVFQTLLQSFTEFCSKQPTTHGHRSSIQISWYGHLLHHCHSLINLLQPQLQIQEAKIYLWKLSLITNAPQLLEMNNTPLIKRCKFPSFISIKHIKKQNNCHVIFLIYKAAFNQFISDQ